MEQFWVISYVLESSFVSLANDALLVVKTISIHLFIFVSIHFYPCWNFCSTSNDNETFNSLKLNFLAKRKTKKLRKIEIMFIREYQLSITKEIKKDDIKINRYKIFNADIFEKKHIKDNYKALKNSNSCTSCTIPLHIFIKLIIV